MENFCIIDTDGESFHSNIALDFSYAEIEEWKHKWDPKKHLDRAGRPRKWGFVTYKVTNTSDHFPDDEFEDKALAIALRQWGFRCKDIRFRKETNKSKTADIEMRFVKAEDDKLFKEKPSTLAYAYFPNGVQIGCDITFNDTVIWSTNGEKRNAHEVYPDKYPPRTKTKLKTYNIIHTLLHECGHAIGLKHCSEHKDCIMYPYYNGKVVLHNHDIERIQTFYGKRKLHSRLIQILRKRMLRINFI